MTLPPRDLPPRVDHLVIGAGFAGLCAAIKLTEDGERDFLVVERGSDVGGTWRDNTYPGAACDVPSQLYSFSFAPYDWSRSYSAQPEILAYLQKVAEEAGVLDRFLFDTSVEHAGWDDTAQEWVVETTRGTVRATTLISGAGGLSEPKLPDVEGIEDFQGDLFHSARWDHSVDLTGKRVAVIGTGASAIQIVPELQKIVGHLDLYQRTAPYVIPKTDRKYFGLERLAMKRIPGLQRLYRAGAWTLMESSAPVFVRPRLNPLPLKQIALAHLARAVKDPDLRARLTPTFEPGCKRVLKSNDYYPAVASDNVDLVTEPIAKITGHAVVTADGAEHPVDAVVVCTGFFTTDQPIAHHITGRDGRTLADHWADTGMRALRGTTIPGFPNFFMIVGPNTGLGHSSMVQIIEAQIDYARGAIRTLREQGLGALEPTQQAHDRWNESVQRSMRHTIWLTGGCHSWYLDEHGRNTVTWPRTTVSFRRELADFDADSYVTTPQEVSA
jgi:cyclohexanone monooxygenase